jgi:hypothetical protein
MENERVIRDVAGEQLDSFKAFLEADGYSVTIEAQSDGLFTLRARNEWNADIQPGEPWPRPGKA